MRRLIVLCCLLWVGVGSISAQEAESRPFYLGFTPFPYEVSVPAVLDTYARIAEDADLIVHHFDNGVPWTEALNGDTYHSQIMDDWALRRSQTPAGHQVLVTATPISINRNRLAPYRGEADDMPLPEPFASYDFDHPDVIQAYITYCNSLIAYFQPDFFVFGIEVNLLMKLNPSAWEAYRVLHRETYTALKAAHPDLPLMASITGIDLLQGYTDANHDQQMQAFEDVMPYSDYFALSVYPYMTAYMTNSLPLTMFDDLAALTDKPLAITETGYPAQSFTVDMGVRLEFNSDAEKQAAYINLLLEKANEYEFRFVVNFVLRDYDALWEMLGAREDLTIVWRDTGLYDENGGERESLRIWREWLALPIAPSIHLS